ncbi:putative importin subunit alpha B [Cavenderia fasciculata]|uniref:Importin subunit alpha n=1 Tax=Cavenderia fasciculata TaxID=261658 RepID=F4QFF7_CACFS|nr:putative importin subunit alpha B [Cavenderia fasciculata]EGG14258.1 putative importin subunit alpha B [Cavenderia fasciculata]|eukprot:XP_004350967.1 putative importin subunit alpha B [Cavenderia fasciculata]
MLRSKQDQRKSQFKKSVDADDARRKREELALSIRKSKREESLVKKRNIRLDPATNQKLESLPALVQGVMSNIPDSILQSTIAFRKLLSIERSPPIEEVIATGVVPRFVQFLQMSNFPQLQFEAAWALTNIASGSPEQTKVVIESGAVSVFVFLLNSPNDDVREQAVWALGNIAGDSCECRDLVLRNGALPPLLTQLMSPNPPKLSMIRNATWTLSNFCRGKPAPSFELVKIALPVLAQLIYHLDEEVLIDACWALSYLSDGPNEKIQAVIDAQVCRRMVELLEHLSIAVQTPALRTVGNIVTGDDSQTQVILNVSALPLLGNLLTNPKKAIKKEACWTISNITAGNKKQIQDVIDANIIPALVNLLKNAEFEIKKEAAWAISNATSGGSPQQIEYLVRQGCIPPLCELLRCNDARIINVALEGIENILQSGKKESQNGTNLYYEYVEDAGGVNKINELQNHKLKDTYERAHRICTNYFDEDNGSVNGLVPEVSSTGSSFTFQGVQNTNFGL